MQQRFVIAGLELVGTDQETVRIFLYFVRNFVARKTVQRRLGDFAPLVLVLSGKGDDGLKRTFPFLQVFFECKIILNRSLNTAADHHCTGLAADLVLGHHLLMEVIHHDFSLQTDSMVVAFHIAPKFFWALFLSNSGSYSTFFTSL